MTTMVAAMDCLMEAYDGGWISHAIFADFAKASVKLSMNKFPISLRHMGFQVSC